MNSLYDLTKSYEENLAFGPYWDGKFPLLPKVRKKTTFLGFELNTPFGISACPLTVNARAIEIDSRLGFDLLTYKSVRSVEFHGNVFPHWLYVDVPRGTDVTNKEKYIASFTPFGHQDPSMTNSFGIHSLRPAYWQEEFRNAQSKLLPGQLLILSVQTTPIPKKTIYQGGRELARLAKEAGAKIVEVNFACPNTEGGKGMVFEDLVVSTKICEQMKKVLGKIPLLVKVGFYKDEESMREFLKRTRGVISGISSVNTYVGKVVNKDGKQTYPGRPTGGISGAVIREIAMRQAKKFVELKKELGLKNLVIIGIGGVTKPSHIDQYLKLGVDAVQTAVGAFADPLLAYRWSRSRRYV